MARTNTLTAYRCAFSYMQRNNPLIEEQREKIKAGDAPQFSLADFIDLYSTNSKEVLVGQNSDRAISLSAEGIVFRNIHNLNVWRISPIAGKQGQPMTVVKKTSKQRYNFGADAVALYNYNIFFYENAGDIIAIFHRQNGSGCKSVFLETANELLRARGLKLEMDLIVPLSDEKTQADAIKITLQYVQSIHSSDAADNIRKKKTIVRDIGLNLEAQDNSKIAEIIRNMQLGKLDEKTAFAMITAELKGAGDFNDATIKFRIGRRTKSVRWDDFEHIIGVYDISERLNAAYSKTKNFIEELTKIADEYYFDIAESGI